MKIELSEHFTYKKILLYSLPNVGTMLAITSFQMADGFFVSNWLGVSSFAAVNLVFPLLMMLVAPGFMIGEGGSAFISKLKGEGNVEKARQYFTLLVAVIFIWGAFFSTLMVIFLPEIVRLLGASEELVPYCLRYGRILFLFIAPLLVTTSFQSLWVMAEKAKTGFYLSVVQGVVHVFLDWLFIVALAYEIEGAATATGLATVVNTIITLWYFSRPNASGLHFVRFRFDLYRLMKICYNGISEMVDAVSVNILELVYNLQLMLLLGHLGVAAIGVHSYVSEVFLSVFFALNTTTVTVVGYKYGAGDFDGIRDLMKKNIVLTLVMGFIMTVAGVSLADEIATLYLGYDPEAHAFATRALRICALEFFLYGFCLVTSGFFTGLDRGTISAVIAVCQSLIAPIIFIYLFPVLFGADNIWYAAPAATVVGAILGTAFLIKKMPQLGTEED